MHFSLFGRKFAQGTGIGELMDDLGRALEKPEGIIMLGGGNPASIPEVNALWRARLTELMDSPGSLEAILAQYDAPQGREGFLETFAAFLNRHFGWPVTKDHIAVTNGSQSAFFALFNLFAGDFGEGRKKRILFPLAPEYIGYADQALGPDSFKSHHPRVVAGEGPFFKYHVDFDDLRLGPDTGALCASRPTNPTGNVLTDGEVDRLEALARAHDVPFLLDNAYGSPFPHILFTDIQPRWTEQMVTVMSLSKLGLPGVRTGLVVARPEVIRALASVNAVLNLASPGLGPWLVEDLIRRDALLSVARDVVRPFYARRAQKALARLRETFDGRIAYQIHEPQGALFFWLRFPGLSLDTAELYQRLKARGTLVVPGHYFWFGLDVDHEHARQCLRLNYSGSEEAWEAGLNVIAEEVEKVQKHP